MTEPLVDGDSKPIRRTVLIDAAMAMRMLKRNSHNRPISKVSVEKLRKDMIAGHWRYTGDPIRFDVNGDLIDGQHRLTALSQCAGITLPFDVMTGFQPDVQMFLDQGVKRTAGQQLGLRSIRDGNIVAAGVKLWLTWQDGWLFRDNKAAAVNVTTAEIEAWVGDNASLVEALSKLLGPFRRNDGPPSVSYCAAIAFMAIDADQAAEFFHKLDVGAGGEGHPINTLDKRLQRIRRDRVKTSNRDYLALFILAWNAWREGKTMIKFQKPRGGTWNADSFPEPK